MSRIATRKDPPVMLTPGDRVLFSARRIPGNELPIAEMIDNLIRQGMEVIDDRLEQIHASGHGLNDEQKRMIELCRPKYFIPLHGTVRLMTAHARLALDAGIPRDRIAILEDGVCAELTRTPDDIDISVGHMVTAGLVCIDGTGRASIDDTVLRDRHLLAQNGVLICVTHVDSKGRLNRAPEIVHHGMSNDISRNFIENCQQRVIDALEDIRPHRPSQPAQEDEIRQALRRLARRTINKNPLVVPIVIQEDPPQ